MVFNQIQSSHAASEDSVNYQTQALSARIERADDEGQNWKFLGADVETEAAAEAAIKAKLDIVTGG